MTRPTAPVPAELFGQTPNGQTAMVYTLENSRLRVRITDYGGRMVSIEAPDRLGRRGDVLLGFDDVAGYMKAGGAFGALLGRNANRIAGGSFTLDSRTYHLPTNDGTSTLHGGPVGFDKVFWKVASATAESAPTLVLTHVSPDGDQGFPGELSVQTTYRLDGDSLWRHLRDTQRSPHSSASALTHISIWPARRSAMCWIMSSPFRRTPSCPPMTNRSRQGRSDPSPAPRSTFVNQRRLARTFARPTLS